MTYCHKACCMCSGDSQCARRALHSFELGACFLRMILSEVLIFTIVPSEYGCVCLFLGGPLSNRAVFLLVFLYNQPEGKSKKTKTRTRPKEIHKRNLPTHMCQRQREFPFEVPKEAFGSDSFGGTWIRRAGPPRWASRRAMSSAGCKKN